MHLYRFESIQHSRIGKRPIFVLKINTREGGVGIRMNWVEKFRGDNKSRLKSSD